MSYRRPESASALTLGVSLGATIGGMVYGAGMIASGLGALSATGLGMGLLATGLGSGLLLTGVSLAGFQCARTALKVAKMNHRQLSAIREAEKTGVMPDANPYRLLDAAMERSPLTMDVARIGGVFIGLAGAIGLVGAGLAAVGGTAVMPILAPSLTALIVGMATHKASRIAEDGLAYAEQKTREASRALRSATPATEWARSPEALMGVEHLFPPEGHFVNKYLEERAAEEATLAAEIGR